jgi:succinoglycan biosynthesis transport protein ExoP
MKTLDNYSQDVCHQKNDAVHLHDYLQVISRRKWLILLFFIVIVGLAAVYSFVAKPVYRATALLMIDKKPSPVNPLGEDQDRSSSDRLPYYNTEINLLSHRTLVEAVIQQLNLTSFYADQLGDPHKLSMFRKFRRAAGIELPQPAPAGSLESNMLTLYYDSLEIDPIQDSNLVNISFVGSDPVMVARIVNTHAAKAIESAVKMHRERAENALRWLRSQVEKQKQEVEKDQKLIYEFKKKNHLVTLDDPKNIHTQELAQLNTELTRAKADRIAKQTAYLEAEKLSGANLDIFLTPELSGNSVIATLRNQLVQLKNQQIELSTKYGPKHPKMVELRAGINQTRADLEKEINRIKKAYKTQADQAAAEEKSITKLLDERKNSAMRLGEKAIQYEVLQQQAESAKSIYDFLLKQSKEINLTSVISSSSLRVVDPADVPILPISPKLSVNLLIAAVFSLSLGIGMAFFLEYLDVTLKTPDDVIRYLGIPVLGAVPYHKGVMNNGRKSLPRIDAKQLEFNELEDGPLASISNRLPVELTTSGEGTIGRVIAIESVTMGEGKTMTTAKMAASLSEAGLRVLLLDCDFQRSALSEILDNSNGEGLENIIRRILSHQVTSGDLKNYSMDDLFFLIGLRKLNGRLVVKNEDQLMHIFFQNGKLLHIQNSNNPKANRIGAMLLQGNSISKDQLNDAIERHRRTGQPLGYILVNSGYISIEKLKGPLRLQMEEHIQRLFSWKTGQFHFKPELIRMYENERIVFGDNYNPLIHELGRISGSKMIEKVILANIRGGSRENLFFLPANSSAKKPIGRINRTLLKKILEIVKERFDVVLIDTPPLDARTGVESLLSIVDGVIIVIDAGNLSYRVINTAINTLPKDKIIGAILNKVKTKQNKYYAYYM